MGKGITSSAEQLSDASNRLYKYILKKHWNGLGIVGPDSGVRWNFRIGRFVKSYLDFLPWRDRYAFLQAQGYWILANWLMGDLFGNDRCQDLAVICSEFVVSTQRAEGYWEYPPVPSRKGRIATVEGNIASIGLVESYRRTQKESLLAAVRKWHGFLIEKIGFQGKINLLAVNYWAGSSAGMVPNNTTLTLWTLAEIAYLTNDESVLQPCEAMVSFLNQVQMENGELPYVIENSNVEGRLHFLCFQYNAFQFLDLVRYYRITGDQNVWRILEKLAIFLSKGVSKSGAARYDCHRGRPEMPYYTAVVALALSQATVLGIGNFRSLADRAYRRLLTQQTTDGGFAFFSRGNYGFLSDRRSYPRNLSMILYHLLLELTVCALPSERQKAG